VENLFGEETLLSKGADRQGVMTFGEADTVLVGEELGVEVVGSGDVKGVLQEDLAGGGFEEVAAADYFGDLHGFVVDYAGELIAGETCVLRILAKAFTPN
jgi:hypothetical protein